METKRRTFVTEGWHVKLSDCVPGWYQVVNKHGDSEVAERICEYDAACLIAAAPRMREALEMTWGEVQEAIRFIREGKGDDAITNLEATIRHARAILRDVDGGE